ncbi:probable WRKY transcription factor protein 1 isoform X2 [Tribolium castaneum]|uniref:probable WRKY transcription factor protein 1 isoform X2 n=1 Tax=Tribolium castaneum TaxID=7070 RepID=UPI00046C1B23|nr:PREDICTED: probable WRKY transcription factor protein 1 isoform X1 [Tribolium castaneum]XP_015840460.1 PREDICTED: probable WRKY transcription factor protein 1 isoform X1 [Tribolium castaneum]XP_015840461.1 PREDICTED: probable WRKY transcription factor protein 1 isoform X1 [Tribolium castaneum]|eukprot:XP_008200212.1 PREDICTED: probable WRKY transcription factor protein 1 isoform X1 [Tribolium castaneum]
MSTYVDKPLSLIERKKLQWAREKEELAGLCAPWGNNKDQPIERPFQRNRHVPKLSMPNSEFFRNNSVTRRSSLPPLSRNQFNSIDKEMGCETSGYGSDNPTNNPENQVTNQSGYESSSSYKDDRPKWKDKNKFWDCGENDPPSWVKRGLQRDEEIVVSNTSPAESPQQHEEDVERPYTSSSAFNRTFIRGQNIPVDSTELAERERRRQIAIAHQEAIRQQLEERERRRLEEKQKRIKEEQEEELRIEREQEIERRRKENELRAIREKQERERKRKEAIKEALELAEKEAKMEKMKQKIMKQNNVIVEEGKNNIEKENETISKKNNLEQEINNNSNNNNNNKCLVVSPRPEVLNNEVNNNLEVTGKSLSPRNNDRSNTPRNVKSSCSFQVLTTPRTEMALVLQTPLETLQNMQYAVLMPGLGGNNAVPIAIPLAIAPEKNNGNYSARTENRILTPTQYRNKNRTVCDSSTQTECDFNNVENSNNQKFIREKLTNLELNYDNKNRRERRSRSDDRCEEKPKWGANRPPTRYMKQSEKDPFYQRRKMRQKTRDYKNSSDESQTGSPRSYRKKNYVEKRHTRALWRKNDHFFARNIRMYQTEIVPLESDKEQIYYPQKCDCCCRCRCETKTEILKIETSPRDDHRLPECKENVENSAYIIDKLASLHNGLVLKQEQWERSPRTPSLSSSTRNTENN